MIPEWKNHPHHLRPPHQQLLTPRRQSHPPQGSVQDMCQAMCLLWGVAEGDVVEEEVEDEDEDDVHPEVLCFSFVLCPVIWM